MRADRITVNLAFRQFFHQFHIPALALTNRFKGSEQLSCSLSAFGSPCGDVTMYDIHVV